MDGHTGLAGRYRVDAEIARGGMGVVYRAYDTVLERMVAVKRPRAGNAEHQERARREALALRLLRVPGVVELLDEGEDAEGRYLVTEFVEGVPFPGAGWPLEGLAAQLLDVLARVHAAGILHRDLKPQNVLVDPAGHVRVLDFGIAHGAALGAALTAAGDIVGTPRYLAPEQLGGAPVDARTDLYALGVMLYEAIAGVGPFADTPGEGALYARVWRDAPPLADRRPTASPALVALVDALVARLPERRPASAAEALVSLGRSDHTPRLRMVGRDAWVAELVAAARARRPMGLTAGPGAGRTRLLEAVAAELVAGGASVIWLVPGSRPLASLRASFGLAAGADPVACRDAAQARLDAGDVLIVDAPDRVDRWSMEAVQGLRGAVIGATEGPALAPLTEADLRELFWGPDKVLHLREDGAHALFRRSRGLPGRAVGVIGEWVGAGLATVDGDRVCLRHNAAPQLADLPVREPAVRVGRLPEDEALRALLPWIVLGDGDVTLAGLAQLTGRPEWEQRLLGEELVEHGLIEVDGAGHVSPRPGAEAALGLWSDERRRGAHRALADLVPAGTPARLRHLAQGGRADEVADEARAVAAAHAAAGRYALACHVLDGAVGLVRHRVAPEIEAALLRDYVLAAFPAEDVRLRQLVAEAVRRSEPARLGGEVLQDLADAAVALARRHLSVAEGLIEELPEQEDEGLERMRAALLVEARCSARPAEAAAEVQRWGPWATVNPARRGRWLGWWGHVCFGAAEFVQAAEAHDAAAALRTDAEGLSPRFNAGLSWLEAGDHARAAARADQVVEQAAALRLPTMELRGWWLRRSIAYRRCAAAAVDVEIVAAADVFAPGTVAGVVCLTEGVIAWRAGALDEACALLEKAAAYGGRASPAAAVADALGARIRGASGEARREVWSRCGDRLPPRVRAQIFTLLFDAPAPGSYPDEGGRYEVLDGAELRTGSIRPDTNLEVRDA